MTKNNWVILFVIILSLNLISPVLAQQTIIIVPSPDALEQGQIYPRITYRFRPFEPDVFNFVNPSVVYGLSNTQELYAGINGLNLNHDVKPIGDLSYKKVFSLTKTTRFTLGARLSTSLSSTITPTNFLYTHFSQAIPLTGTRFTAGVYASAIDRYYPNKTGAVLGVEQYLIPNKLQCDVDWISGNETFGYLAAGFKIKPGHGVVIVPAILIPNGSKGKLGFIFFIGKIFGGGHQLAPSPM